MDLERKKIFRKTHRKMAKSFWAILGHFGPFWAIFGPKWLSPGGPGWGPGGSGVLSRCYFSIKTTREPIKMDLEQKNSRKNFFEPHPVPGPRNFSKSRTRASPRPAEKVEKNLFQNIVM